MHAHTPRNFALQLGALISLYLSISFLLVLVFGAIDLTFPDATDTYWQTDSAQSSVRFGIAFLLVFFPVYLILTRSVNRIRRDEKEGSYLTLTRWLIYLSLLVGGGVLLGDLVAVIMAFLEGEITLRFILKALAVLLAVGSAFYYYLQDARGVWIKQEKRSKTFGAAAIAIWLAAIVFGFTTIDSPTEVRAYELDETQVRDLQEIQSRIIGHIQTFEELPFTIEEIYEGTEVPNAPEDRQDYAYNQTDEGFELCASFAKPSRREEFPTIMRPFPNEDLVVRNTENWDHESGRHCFQRYVELPNDTESEAGE